MSNLVEHARRELEVFETDQEYIDGICKVIQAFADMGHSNSAYIAIPQIEKLLRFENLTPLTDNPDEWNHICDERTNGEEIWQSQRNPEAFSTDGGKNYYLTSECKPHIKINHISKSATNTGDSNA